MKKINSIFFVLSIICLVLFLSVGGSAKTTLTYWTFIEPTDPGPRSQVQSTLIQNFEKEHPEIDVNIEVQQWQKIPTQLIIASNSKKGPDLVRIFEPMLIDLIKAKVITPLNEYIGQITEEEKEKYVIPWEATVVNGEKYGFFWDTRIRHLWYRKDLLEKAGLHIPEDLPNTLEELAILAQKVQTKEITGIFVATSVKDSSAIAETFLPLLYGAGGKILNEDGTAAYNSEAGVKVAEWIKDLIYKYKVMPEDAPAMSFDDQYQAFLGGTVAFIISGSHRVVDARNKSALGDNIQTMPIPSFDAVKPSPAWTSGWILAIGTYSEHKKEAYELLKYMTSKEAQLLSAKVAGEMPSRTDVLDDPWFSTSEAKDMVGWINYANKYPLMPRLPDNWQYFTDCLAEGFEKLIMSDVTAKEALDLAAAKYNKF